MQTNYERLALRRRRLAYITSDPVIRKCTAPFFIAQSVRVCDVDGNNAHASCFDSPKHIPRLQSKVLFFALCVGLYSSCLLRVFDLHFDCISQGLLWYM
jgi:hypothetical protein